MTTKHARRLHNGRCHTCGKFRYLRRADAKKAARANHPNDVMRAYLCGDTWHYGHTPAWVKRGEQR
jgi:hypothetical protein